MFILLLTEYLKTSLYHKIFTLQLNSYFLSYQTMDQQQGVTTNRPVVIQVSGGSGATARKNDNQSSSNQPQFVTLSTTGGQQVIISGNEGIDAGHQIITSSHLVQGATVQVNKMINDKSFSLRNFLGNNFVVA